MKSIQIADFVSHHLTFKGKLSRFPYLVLLPGTKGSNKYGDDPRLNNKKVKKIESSLKIS